MPDTYSPWLILEVLDVIVMEVFSAIHSWTSFRAQWNWPPCSRFTSKHHRHQMSLFVYRRWYIPSRDLDDEAIQRFIPFREQQNFKLPAIQSKTYNWKYLWNWIRKVESMEAPSSGFTWKSYSYSQSSLCSSQLPYNWGMGCPLRSEKMLSNWIRWLRG